MPYIAPAECLEPGEDQFRAMAAAFATVGAPLPERLAAVWGVIGETTCE